MCLHPDGSAGCPSEASAHSVASSGVALNKQESLLIRQTAEIRSKEEAGSRTRQATSGTPSGLGPCQQEQACSGRPSHGCADLSSGKASGLAAGGRLGARTT